MLVCSISQQTRRAAITADVVEAAAAADANTIGNIIFATLVDDPASVVESIDAFLGELMVETANALDAFDAGLNLAATMVEAASAGEAHDGTVVSAPAGATWNPADKAASVTLSGDLLTATSNLSASVGSVRASKSIATGKGYFELKATFTSVAGGWHGLTTAAKSLTAGTSSGAATCNISNGSQVEINGTHMTFLDGFGTFVNNDVLCVALDLGNQRIWFRRNGGQWNGSGTANPATNTGGFDVSMLFTSAAAFPVAQFSNTGAVNNIAFNGGASAFAQTIPSGFTGWNSA